MKSRLILTTLLIIGTLVTSVCRKTETPAPDLEELPKDIAAQLQRVPNSELLVSVPRTPARAVNKPPAETVSAAPGVKPLDVNCSIHTTFLLQVYYPVTVCSSVRDLSNVLANYDALMGPGPKASTTPTEVKNYKLSSFQGKPLTSVFCQVRNGPWLARIEKERDCDLRESCAMTIGVPSVPVFLWNGEKCQSQGRPPEVQYLEPMITEGVTSTPCNSKSTCS